MPIDALLRRLPGGKPERCSYNHLRVVLRRIGNCPLLLVEETVYGVALDTRVFLKLPRRPVRRSKPDDVAPIGLHGTAHHVEERGLACAGRSLDKGKIRPPADSLDSGFLALV